LPFATIQNTRLFYRLEGTPGRPVLILSHSIGTDHSMWEPQFADLLRYFQVLRYDTRGHGASDAPSGEYSIEQLGRDVLGLADRLGISKFAFCGLSLGGAIGQWVGGNEPNRVTHLVLSNTSPQFGPPATWNTRMETVLKSGMAAIVDMAMQRFFLPETMGNKNPYAESIRALLLGTDPIGYAGCCAAIRDVDHTALLEKIKAPTLVIVGERDVSTPWTGHGEIIAAKIAGARAVHLPTAHLSNLERPRSFNAALLEFVLPPVDDPLQAGYAVRRSVLGEAHVDKAIATTNDFNREFQDLITRYAWGATWTRPALDPRTRRLLVLATTAAMGRWEEFRLHVRAGFAHDLELCDLKEVLLQTAIYAGVPAANTGFHMAIEELAKPQ
jgi:3-oxoadipate enol-lactonase / 4-carboxymuconolactone decarboxylase